MALRNYKRFWHPRGQQPAVGFDGFVYDPESDYAKFASPVLVTLEALQDERCLILLGEPGMGKTMTLRELSAASPSDRERRALDLLRDCGSDYLLFKELFDASWFKEWEAGNGQLELLLDSLDEARLAFPTIDSVLAKQLQARATSRLAAR